MNLEGPAETVHREVDNGVGRLILDRPKTLNALDLVMVRALRDALEAWRDDDDVSFVLVESASEKAFCAGGDIRAVRAAVLGGKGDDAETFFEEEYELNLCIAEYPKPYIALIDGICFGGGVGISVHGSHRIATERACFAMPETAIGFVPDVGSSHFLPRMPNGLGRAMGLSGLLLKGADAVPAGFGTHFIQSSKLAVLRSALLTGTDPNTVLADITGAAQLDTLPAGLVALASCFGPADLPSIVRRVDEADSAWANGARTGLAAASPMSLQVTDELLRVGADSSLVDCLRTELAVVKCVIRSSDFSEGVRARLVDKDSRPRWIEGATLSAEVGATLEVLRCAERQSSIA